MCGSFRDWAYSRHGMSSDLEATRVLAGRAHRACGGSTSDWRHDQFALNKAHVQDREVGQASHRRCI